MRVIDSDESGELEIGYFYFLDVVSDIEFVYGPLKAGSIVAPSSKGVHELCEILVSSVILEQTCPIDSTHVTGRRFVPERLPVADLFGEERLSSLIPTVGQGSEITITKGLSDLLRDSAFTGFALMPLTIQVNQSQIKKPELSALYFTGRNCQRPWKINAPVPNICPRCGISPVVCPACHSFNIICPNCEQRNIGLENEDAGETHSPYTMIDMRAEDRVLDASLWDGSDFFGHRFATGRVIEWLKHMKAKPFVAIPCRINVTGIDANKRRRLDAVAYQV